MPTAYANFSIEDLNILGVEVIEKPLFAGLEIPEKAPSDFLTTTLERISAVNCAPKNQNLSSSLRQF